LFLSSQPTFDTTLNTPRRVPLAPESLTRIKPDRTTEGRNGLIGTEGIKQVTRIASSRWLIQRMESLVPHRYINILKGHNVRRGQASQVSIGYSYKLYGQRAPTWVFDQNTWEQKLLNLVTVSHLPFLFLEYQEFQNLISYARLAPTAPIIPSRKAPSICYRKPNSYPPE
ncbi:hypothetical protein N7476_006770, partial [Penicillium atrosanguineum]